MDWTRMVGWTTSGPCVTRVAEKGLHSEIGAQQIQLLSEMQCRSLLTPGRY